MPEVSVTDYSTAKQVPAGPSAAGAIHSGQPVLLENLSWSQISRLVSEGGTLCLLPVGAIEQHGPHLPTSTDAVIATALCHEASSRTGVAVLPTLSYASSQGHTGKWPGTFALSPRLLIATVTELSRWVASSGFTRLLLVNAHGGNDAPLRVAVDEIRIAGELQIGLITWFTIDPAVESIVMEDGADIHANSAETSLMLHIQPHLVDQSLIEDDPDRTIGKVFTYTVAQTSRAGVTGKPSRATAQSGARLFEQVVKFLTAKIEAARVEEPPTID